MFCESSGALVPKDKAVKRFIVRNIVESAAIRDLQESCVYECACPVPPRGGSSPPCDCPGDRRGAVLDAAVRSSEPRGPRRRRVWASREQP